MTRLFLIEHHVRNYDWKITGNQKQILDYQCIEAERFDADGKKIKVWFAPEIQIPLGPALYNNLPGIVLAVDENDGQKTIVATSIQDIPPDESLLVKPKEGKKVTEEEFVKIRDEKMKEMKATSGGNYMIIKQ